MSKLTAKQEQFCINIGIFGKSQAEAYRIAYNAQNMADKDIYSKASRLAKDGKVRARISELKSKLEKEAIHQHLYTHEQWFKDAEAIRNLALSEEKFNLRVALMAVREMADSQGIANRQDPSVSLTNIVVANEKDASAVKDVLSS